ncbi:MAG: glucosamine-6-phosphate deaminase [Pseudobutyrivibrio sp.]|nr:glucosamine-6-phosphate deaminase [Pseudobutyrivibrio sp.]MCF0185330.1 glucosamine-6-phosphate deaminase [Bacteroidaceae bacterium]
MKVYKGADYKEVSRIVANLIADQIKVKPDSVLGLATGSTPEGTYEELVNKYNNREIDFSLISTINLDEYVGLEPDNCQSYRYYMNTHLFDRVNIDKKNTHIPDGLQSDDKKACEDYEACIERLGKVSLQLLGIGTNGHIGFNEPDESFSTVTHCVRLSDSTIKANSRFFESMEEVPKKAYTMGIGTIMKADKIVLVATGSGKREILKKALEGKVIPSVPASILQLHDNVVLVGDEEALGDNFNEYIQR